MNIQLNYALLVSVALSFVQCTQDLSFDPPGEPFTFSFDLEAGSMYSVSGFHISREELYGISATEIRERVKYYQANPNHPHIIPSPTEEGKRNFSLFLNSDENKVFVLEGYLQMSASNEPEEVLPSAFYILSKEDEITLCPDLIETSFSDLSSLPGLMEVSTSYHAINPDADPREISLFGQKVPLNHWESRLTLNLVAKLEPITGRLGFRSATVRIDGFYPPKSEIDEGE